ncbi:MAG: hypothetical protein QM638_18935 [Nocardioides sp.]|uniref:hypothetical protein n=1 Tax=Nocardioides sp. TaxID=35761 RepID=UPI0039E50281
MMLEHRGETVGDPLVRRSWRRAHRQHPPVDVFGAHTLGQRQIVLERHRAPFDPVGHRCHGVLRSDRHVDPPVTVTPPASPVPRSRRSISPATDNP